MNYINNEILVSTKWLNEQLGNPDICIIDASWFLPNSDRNSFEEYRNQHIPGAVFFDIDLISEKHNNLPHMLPKPDIFSKEVGKLGIRDGVKIIVYDSNGGCMAAHRVWWTFRVFGHKNIAVLDGGFKKWQHEGRLIEAHFPTIIKTTFSAKDPILVRSLSQVLLNIESEEEQLVDARSAGRFYGTVSEPRNHLPSGHIPKSLNLPFEEILNKEHFNTMKNGDELIEAFKNANIDLSLPIITCCGSGVTACCLAFSLYLMGNKNATVYDGSWAEWGADPTLPIVTG